MGLVFAVQKRAAQTTHQRRYPSKDGLGNEKKQVAEGDV
jgi:hypothetical protein